MSQLADEIVSGRTCGIVMPIADYDGQSEQHWLEVRGIIEAPLTKAGFKVKMVSDGDAAGVIHRRILNNLQNCDLIVCDVSCRNPNVMFELGLRLAFDMPLVVIKDRDTSFSFDVAPIEHLQYPRGLRHSDIEKFQQDLVQKAISTVDSSESFLESFGIFPKRNRVNGAIDDPNVLNIDEKRFDSIKGDLLKIIKTTNEIDTILDYGIGAERYRRIIKLPISARMRAKNPFLQSERMHTSFLNEGEGDSLRSVFVEEDFIKIEFEDYADPEIMVNIFKKIIERIEM